MIEDANECQKLRVLIKQTNQTNKQKLVKPAKLNYYKKILAINLKGWMKSEDLNCFPKRLLNQSPTASECLQAKQSELMLELDCEHRRISWIAGFNTNLNVKVLKKRLLFLEDKDTSEDTQFDRHWT